MTSTGDFNHMAEHVTAPDHGAGEPIYPYGGTITELNRSLSATSRDWDIFPACPVCSSGHIRDFAVIRHFRHSRCAACGLIFVNPTPPAEVLSRFYNSTFYANYRRAERDRSRDEPYYMISMYTDKYSLAERVASRAPQSVLDYGCGSGAFLALLRDKYGINEVAGLEISGAAREVAESCYSLKLAESPADLSRKAYDFVLLLEVIEHVPDPLGFLSLVSGLVGADGHVLITTPAVDGFLARRARVCPHYTAPSHLSLFTTKALRVLLHRCGFEVIEVATDRPSGLAVNFAASTLYDMDFVSPQHKRDDHDVLYQPNSLGRMLGLRATREPLRRRQVPSADVTESTMTSLPPEVAGDPLLRHRLLSIAAGAASTITRHLPLGADHLYVVARRRRDCDEASHG